MFARVAMIASSRVRLAAGVAAAAVAAVCPTTTAAADSGQSGAPTVERSAMTVTFFDDYIFELCGVATNTTLTERVITKTYPDGSQTVHINARFVPEDPRIASEQDARTDVIAPDGTRTVKGLAIRLYREGEGTIIRDAGWVRFLEDGLLTRGPHPFLETDPADVFC